MAEKTWASFKIIFAEEYNDLVEETKVTTGYAGFHLANAMEDIGGGARTPIHSNRGQQGHCIQVNRGGGATEE